MITENKKILTLCFVFDGDKVLLGMKKRGFGAGLWNGFGGKVEGNEGLAAAMIREMKEECGITLLEKDLEPAGKLEFFLDNLNEALEVNVFKAYGFSGKPRESAEMKPRWFKIKEAPFDEMWDDDKYWYEYLVAGKYFSGKFYLDKDDKVKDYSLEVTEAPPVSGIKYQVS